MIWKLCSDLCDLGVVLYFVCSCYLKNKWECFKIYILKNFYSSNKYHCGMQLSLDIWLGDYLTLFYIVCFNTKNWLLLTNISVCWLINTFMFFLKFLIVFVTANSVNLIICKLFFSHLIWFSFDFCCSQNKQASFKYILSQIT